MNKAGLRAALAKAVIEGVTEARARIFDHVLNPTGQRSTTKLLKRMLKGEKVLAWYPEDINKDPLVKANLNTQRLEKLESLKLRGKGPPTKGEGRQAAKRKK